MAKERNIYVCQECGYESTRWMGRCPDCGQWNSLVEERDRAASQAGRARGLTAAAGGGRKKTTPTPLTEIDTREEPRVSTKIAELDRVLGGGVVPGSVVLIGGDPGIGKSTLLMQAAAHLPGEVLYVSGEESDRQIKLRAERLGVDSGSVFLFPETALDTILEASARMNPSALVVDSIQTMYSVELSSAPGSVGQVRECATRLMFHAKATGTPVFIVGHVTKEGNIAGPKVLEHIVDTVLYFEGDKGHAYRLVRTVKNRFGSTNEIGIFEMSDSGLSEIENPSELFLGERQTSSTGSVVMAGIEGTRPILVELQALVSTTSFGMPRRTSIGMDVQRVNLLLAVLEKIGGLNLGGMDVYTNVVGGLRLSEPALDLPVTLAVASSLRDMPVDRDLVVFGEIGLSGEVRGVGQAEVRLREAAKIGFTKALVPSGNYDRLKNPPPEINIKPIKTVVDALEEVSYLL